MKSAIGDPLRAEIDLVDLAGAEAVRSILAIASQATYRDLGLAFPPGLEGANVTLVRRLDGTYGALVTTSRPVGGGELNIVLSLTTTSGQQLRNYRVGAPPVQAAAPAAAPNPDTPRANPIGPSNAAPSTAAPAATAAFTPTGADAAQPPLTLTNEAPRAASVPAAAMPPVPLVVPAPLAAPAPVALAPMPASPVAAPAPFVAPAAPPPDRSASSRSGPMTDRSASSRSGPMTDRSDAAPAVSPTVTVVRGETATSIARRVKPADVDDAQAVMALYRQNQRAFSGSVHNLPEGAVLTLPDPGQMRELPPARARAALRAQRPDPSRALATVPAGDRLRLSEGGRGGSKELDGGGSAAARQRTVAFDAAMNEAQSRITQLQANVAGLTKLIEAKDRQMADLKTQLGGLVAPAVPQAAGSVSGVIIPVGAATATMVTAATRDVAVAPPVVPEPESGMPPIEWIAAAVGGVLLIGLLVFVIVRRRRQKKRETEEDIEWPTWAPSQN